MKVAIFTPYQSTVKSEILRYYPMVDPALIIPIDPKAKAKVIKDTLASYAKSFDKLGVTHVLVASIPWFKPLTKIRKVTYEYGKLIPGGFPGYEKILISITPSYKSLFYQPDNIQKINMAVNAIQNGERSVKQVIRHTPESCQEMEEAIQDLHQWDILAVDIEGFSLQYMKAQIGTIAFAWSDYEGLALPVRYEGPDLYPALRKFFLEYQGNLIFHNSSYDTAVMIFELFMEHPLDYRGMLDALDVFYRSYNDTKLMVYLIKNSTSDISLKLKDNILEEYGDYGVDVTDITQIPIEELLEYNQTDACGTFWLYEQYLPLLKEKNLLGLYQEQFLPAQKVLTYMQMVGMPMVMEKILFAQKQLATVITSISTSLQKHPEVHEATHLIRVDTAEKATAKLKKLVKTADDYPDLVFNPGSKDHLKILIHTVLGYEVIDLTPTGKPAMGADTLEKHLVVKENTILQEIIELSKAEKIQSTFIKAFLNGADKGDGMTYLLGNFNLGGTQSMRLSSSDPNLTNLPSGSHYSGIIKDCFSAPDGMVMIGCDYTALEAMVDALVTRDPEKLKIYEQGYDSHSLRTSIYWLTKMPDIMAKLTKAETATTFWKENNEYHCE